MTVNIHTVSHRPQLDDRPLARRVGLVALATDHTSEPDYHRMLAARGIGLYANRIPYANPVTPETLRAMEPQLTEGAALILPGESLDAVIYGCTAASVVIGDAAVVAAVQRAKPGVAVVTPTSAAVAGLRALNAGRISVLTPYTARTSAAMAGYFEAAGFAIDRFTCLGLEDDREMARIAPDAILAAAAEATDPGSDALFISCTAVRAAGLIGRIEAATGVASLSSNYAAAWNVLRICGDAGAACDGRLMGLPLGTP